MLISIPYKGSLTIRQLDNLSKFEDFELIASNGKWYYVAEILHIKNNKI